MCTFYDHIKSGGEEIRFPIPFYVIIKPPNLPVSENSINSEEFSRSTEEILPLTKNLVSLIFASALFLSGCLAQEETPIADQGPEECMDAVKVVVWSDTNGDGVQDADEAPIDGALVMLVPRDDPTSGGLEGTTPSSGIVHFPTREMQDCNPHHYQAIFPVQFAGHEFPSDPVIDLDNFNPDSDSVEFGLLPSNDDSAGPPTIDFAGCEVFSESEIVEYIGPLISAPINNASVGEEVGSFEGCIYAGSEGTIIISYGPSPGISAQVYYDQLRADFPDEAVEMVSGFSEAAVWINQGEFTGTLAVLRGDIVITINVSGESPRSIAEEIAPLVIERIPTS